ncbi:hypothetical protein MN116_002042 [Schistosoma mekongi]|uniref:TGF-beta family profile domain-containing protein n=1 Tax=Schistosoma mekongi TaxID=38744 RepID=A0AAE1ZIM4_SCHME|nr:hypothetical protein MN116_002042 [Schistosoma mekongi]
MDREFLDMHKYQLMLLLTIIILFNLINGILMNFNENLLLDTEILKVLSNLKGIPKNMTKYELNEIRKTIPKTVENWINFMNNEQFLHDYEYGRITKDIYNDLQKSIVFLHIVPCEINTVKQLKYCFIFQPSSNIPKYKIQLATLSAYIHSWINPNQLKLHVFLINTKYEVYEHFYINLNNKTLNNVIEYSNMKSIHRVVTWDISLMMKNLQYSKYQFIHSIIMTLVNINDDDNNVDDIHLNYINLFNQKISYSLNTLININDSIENVLFNNYNNEKEQLFKNENINKDTTDEDDSNINVEMNEIFNEDNINNNNNNNNNELTEINNEKLDNLLMKQINNHKFYKNIDNIIDNVLHHNTQIIINMKTKRILQLENQYSIRKRLIHRSFLTDSIKSSHHLIQSCPSFLDKNKRETKCCLFRYTLNKMQMDQNDKLRFIIFPHHLPMNMCHGRCIGLYMPTDNAHSILMNRYFSGLGSVEREAIYNSMPCCAANETIPFTILYKNHKDQLVTETLPKAVKTNCACS